VFPDPGDYVLRQTDRSMIAITLRCSITRHNIKVGDDQIVTLDIVDRERIFPSFNDLNGMPVGGQDLFERGRQVVVVVYDQDLSLHNAPRQALHQIGTLE